MKSILYFLMTFCVIYSCSTTNGEKKAIEENADYINEKEGNKTLRDSATIWVSTIFEESIQKDMSICDCWRNTRYHFLYYDTAKMQLYLKSNLIHYGHDSDLIFPLTKTGNVFKYDSATTHWPEPSKEFELPSNDTLMLLDGNKSYTFIKRVVSFQKDTSQNRFFIHSKLRNIFYVLNSHVLLKYNEVDSVKSTHDLIDPKELKDLIKNQKVIAHCSDDFYLDGITIQADQNRYFQLVFGKGEVTLFEHFGRNKRQKLNLDTLPKQVLRIE